MTNTPAYFSRSLLRSKRILEYSSDAHRIAKQAGLEYVTIGNVPGHKYNSTFCPNCGERLIHRIHFQVLSNNIENRKCKFCASPIPGIWI